MTSDLSPFPVLIHWFSSLATDEKGEGKSLVDFLALPDTCVNILFLVYAEMTDGHCVCVSAGRPWNGMRQACQ